LIHLDPAQAATQPAPATSLYISTTSSPLITPSKATSKRPVTATKFMDDDQGINLINAELCADQIGCPLLAHVTFHWAMSSAFSGTSISINPREQIRFQGQLFDKAAKWMKRQGIKQIAHIWTREWATQKHLHTHLRLNLPASLWDEFKEFLLQSGSFSRDRLGLKGEAIRITGGSDWRQKGGRGAVTATERAGQLLYQLKALKPTTTLPGTTDGIFDPIGIGTEQSLPIYGKRCGTSQTLSPKARRDAGWRDLTSWAEIDAALMASRNPWDRLQY
jgi:hypothetical protein